jgi:hypothetical protein
MIWRDRLVEARARGWFTDSDFEAWTRLRTCPAAELCLAYGIGMAVVSEPGAGAFYHDVLHTMGDGFSDLMAARDFDQVEALFDAMEDQALRIKREQST